MDTKQIPLGASVEEDGSVVIQSTRRPNGTFRKPIRVRKGYVPPDEVKKYKPGAFRRNASDTIQKSRIKEQLNIPSLQKDSQSESSSICDLSCAFNKLEVDIHDSDSTEQAGTSSPTDNTSKAALPTHFNPPRTD